MRLLNTACLILALAGLPGAASGQIGGPIDLGDLPAGKKVRVHFDTTVDMGLGPLVMQVENQGTVESSTMAFGPVPTDDPDDGVSEVDFTVTPLDGLTIGNLVWNEKTGNLVFNPATADAGIDGVLVNLYLDDGDGVLDAGDGAPIAADTTAGGGFYSFAGVQPGDYIVEVAACNSTGMPPCAGAPLAGLSSLAGAPDPDNDVDNDDNGAPVAGFGVAAAAVTLTFGGETLGNEDGDSDADTNLTVDFGFAPETDLALDKSDDGTDAVAGENYVYMLKVNNNGPGASSGSTVTDTLPSGWSFVSGTGCVGDGGSPVETVTCTFGAIPAAGMSTVAITVAVPADAAAGTVTNSASVAGAESDPVAGNNGDSEMTTVVTEADVELTSKTDSPDPVVAGEQLTYTINFINNGPSDAQSVNISDPIPAGTRFVSSTKPGSWGSIEPPVGGVGGTVQFLKTTAADGATATFTITVEVESSVAAGSTIDNTATVSATTTDPTSGNDVAMESTTVSAETDLALDKSDDGTDASAGTNYDYTLKVTNNGPSDSTGGTVSDTLPTGWTFVSATGGTCVATASGFDCTVDPLADGAMQTFVVTVAVPASAAAATVTNSATVTANETDPTAGNDTDTEMTTVVPSTDLEIDKSDDGTDVVAGTTYDYDIKITNNGPADSTGGTVTDTLPTGWTYVSATGGTCAAAVGGFTCTVDPLTNGSMQTFTVTVAVPSSATAGTVTNSASVAANESDLVAGNNSDSEMTDVVVDTDLELDKSDSGLDVAAGETYIYTLKVTNNGPSDSTGGTLSDTLPAGWTFVSATGGTCVGTATGFDCTVGALTSGAMQTFLATVQVPSSAAAGTVTNSASVTANETDSTAGNNSDTEMTTVIVETDLALVKSDEGSDVVAGETYDYTLEVTNNGPSDSTGGSLSDTLPAGWTFVSATGGTCVATASGFDCTVGALASGAMQTFVATASVPSSEVVGLATNTATVTANETDSTAANDTSVAKTPVVREVDLVVTKTESVDPVVAGESLPGNLTYVVTVENMGPSDVTGLSVDEDLTLPAPDVTVDSITPSAGAFTPTAAPDGTWDGFDLAAGASETLTVVISVGPTAPFGIDTISNTATVTGSTGSETFVNTGDDSATESTTISTGPPAFAKVFDPDTIGEEFETTLTFTIDNTMNGLAAADLAFLDVLPPMLRVADVPNVVNTCGGTVTAPAGSTSIELAGGTVAGFGSCELSVSIFAPSTGVLVNTSGDLTSSLGNSGPATDTLTVVGCAATDGSNLTLGSHVVLVPETYEVCNTLEVEEHFQVLGPNGILELRAGVAVAFYNGVEVAQDGVLKVVLDPALVP